MSDNRFTIIHNALLGWIPAQPAGWVAVDGDTIAAVGTGNCPFDDFPAHAVRTDARGAILLPGLIDTHVHFREPGLTHKGDIATESAAAVLGGITSYIEMPNTNPTTTTAEAFRHKLALADGRSRANYAFMLGASDNVMTALDELDPTHLPAVKLFMGNTTGGMAAPVSDRLDAMMRYCTEHNIPVVVHAEDNAIIAENTRKAIEKYGSPEAVPLHEHSRIRSAEACLSSARSAVALAREHGTRLHLAHISTTPEAEELLAAGPLDSKQITAETTPLYLDPEFCHAEKRTWRHKINPAIKEFAPGLVQALKDDRIDTLATDHAPHLVAEKQGGALKAASGAPSVQFALPVMLEYLSPDLIARKMASAPAKLFGIERRGAVEPGYAADLVLVEKCAPYTIDDTMVQAPCLWTPFHGRRVTHRVRTVLVNGHEAVADGVLTSSIAGKALTFNHSLCTTSPKD